jgi:preprotein translocase subunit Sec61beta
MEIGCSSWYAAGLVGFAVLIKRPALDPQIVVTVVVIVVVLICWIVLDWFFT